MDNLKVLIVEDDPNLGQILAEYLEIKGFKTTLCKDGEEGFNTYSAGLFDLCILDIMMPKKDGFTLAQEIKNINNSIPIIFLTAKSLVEDRIKGLKLGGDDYLTKPFSSEELLLRINNIFKRVSISKEKNKKLKLIPIGKYKFDYPRRILSLNNSVKRLTSKESELLRLFALNQNEVLERSIVLTEIWQENSYFTSRSMD
ncbi:MAG: response regulator transcription factor, partial [Cyclobacteriaceae bacterium]|nr:response regulator transcription factor [Cyclobacteriaceae bacterium]